MVILALIVYLKKNSVYCFLTELSKRDNACDCRRAFRLPDIGVCSSSVCC